MKETKGDLWELLLPFGGQMGHKWGIRTIANFKHTAILQSISAKQPPNQMPQYIFYGQMGH
ncbi:MAG: hypothetical protein ACTHJ0_04730 [Flavipsychrobacter sp.]